MPTRRTVSLLTITWPEQSAPAENPIEFLSTCRQRDAKKITEDTALRTSFFEIVKILAAAAIRR